MPFGGEGTTPQVTTGNVRTTYDIYDTTKPFNNQKNPLGAYFTDTGGADSVSGTLTQLPVGQVAVYKYVLYKSITNPALVAAPGVVYYTDNTGTVVSGAIADGFIHATTAASLSDVAGYLMPNTTDLSALTATILNNGGNGSYVWICVSGFVKAAMSITSTVAGDYLYGGATSFTPQRIAAHTAGGAFVDRLLAQALTSLSGAVSDVNVLVAPSVAY